MKDLSAVANLLVILDVVSRPSDRIESKLHSFGPTLTLAPRIWTTSTSISPGEMLRELAPMIGPHDRLMVVDASNDRAAWYNFGPAFEAILRKQWQASRAPGTAPTTKPLKESHVPAPGAPMFKSGLMADPGYKSYLQKPLAKLLKQSPA